MYQRMVHRGEEGRLPILQGKGVDALGPASVGSSTDGLPYDFRCILAFFSLGAASSPCRSSCC